MNTRAGNNHNQVASVQRNIMQHYSTKYELQQTQEPSAVDEEIKRLQEKRAAMVAGNGDPSTSTLNPNLSGPQQTTLNPFAQPFASTLPFPVPQPRKMPGLATSFQTPLFGCPGTKLMEGTVTQMRLQAPTSVAISSAQPPPGDGFHISGRPSGAAVSSQKPRF